MHFVWFRSTSLRVFKFLQIKEGGPNFWGEPILQNVWIILSPLLYLNLKRSMDRNSLSFIRLQSILHEWGRLFSESWNFYKLKRGKPILQNVWIIWSPFCIKIFKPFQTQILHHSLDFNAFCVIQEYSFRGFQIFIN